VVTIEVDRHKVITRITTKDILDVIEKNKKYIVIKNRLTIFIEAGGQPFLKALPPERFISVTIYSKHHHQFI